MRPTVYVPRSPAMRPARGNDLDRRGPWPAACAAEAVPLSLVWLPTARARCSRARAAIWRRWAKFLQTSCLGGNIKHVPDRNVLGGPLEPCGTDPLTGYYRDGCCSSGPEDVGRHTICAVMTAEFLEHQRSIGNDLLTPVPEYRFPGLLPGDRWCVTALNWLRAHHDGCAAPVVLASTHERTLEVVPLETLEEHKVDVPDDLANL
jgi:uncharacterized protein (DUF2237 family)